MGGYIERISGEIADILLREGIDYTQTKAVFKAARAKAGLFICGSPMLQHLTVGEPRNNPETQT